MEFFRMSHMSESEFAKKGYYMNTFLHFLKNLKAVPMVTSWTLEELAQMKGHQELYTKQSPQRLRKLREFSMIERVIYSALPA